MGRIAKYKVSDLEVPQGLLPRVITGTVEEKVKEYAELMENGVEFDPIKVWERPDGKIWIVDGVHRKKACELIGKAFIEGEALPIKDELHYRMEAIKYNLKHGLALKPEERKLCAQQLYLAGVEPEDIQRLFGVSDRTIRRWLSDLRQQEKKELKEKIKKLSTQGLTKTQIAKELGISRQLVDYYLQKKDNMSEFSTPTVRSVLDDPEKLAQQEERELLEVEEEEKQKPALWRDSNLLLSTVLYWVGECMPYLETGSSPEEAVELAGVHPNVREAVLTELKERLEKREQEIARWVEKCKSYIDAGFEPKKAVSEAGVPEEIKNAVVKKLVGYKNHLYQEEEKAFKAELGPVDSRRRDIILKAHQLVNAIQEIERMLKELDAVFLKDPEFQDEANYYGRDQYIRDYLTFILVRGGWDKAEWFREITKRWIRYTLHPSYAEEFIEDMKEQAKLSPEEWEKISIKYWEENLASEAELKWKKFCESLGLPVLKEYGGTE